MVCCRDPFSGLIKAGKQISLYYTTWWGNFCFWCKISLIHRRHSDILHRQQWEQPSGLMDLAACTQSIYNWLRTLVLNPDKSEACMFGYSTCWCSIPTSQSHVSSAPVIECSWLWHTPSSDGTQRVVTSANDLLCPYRLDCMTTDSRYRRCRCLLAGEIFRHQTGSSGARHPSSESSHLALAVLDDLPSSGGLGITAFWADFSSMESVLKPSERWRRWWKTSSVMWSIEEWCFFMTSRWPWLVYQQFCGIASRAVASHTTHHWHLTSTRETSTRPRILTYEVFASTRGHGPVDCKWCLQLQAALLQCSSSLPVWTSCNMSRTALHGWWQVHAIETTSNQFLKICTGFPFGQESSSRWRHSSTKSEQATSHHTLQTSLMTTVQQGHFIPYRWLFSRSHQWGVQTDHWCFNYSVAKHGTTYHKLYGRLRHLVYLGGILRNI